MTRRLISSIALLAVAALPAIAQKTKVRQVSPSSAPEVYEVETGAGRSYFGVDISDISKERASTLNVKDDRGVEVTQVDQDAPAGKAGFKEHDVIVNFNGTPVESEEQFRRLVRETRPGRTVAVDIVRNGQAQTLKVQLADRKRFMAPVIAGAPRAFAFPVPPSGAVPPMAFEPPDVPHDWTDQMVTRVYRSPAGVMVENLSPQLGDYFGVKNAEGMLIRSVQKGSAADSAGLRAGDVIVRVGDQKITDHSDWAEAMRNPKHEKVSVTIVRDRRELTVPISLPARSRDSSSLDDETTPGFEGAGDEIAGALDDMQPAVRKTVDAATEAASRAITANQKQIAKAMEKASTELANTLIAHRGDFDREIQKAMAEASAEVKTNGSDVDKAIRELQKAIEKIHVEFDQMQ